jgi:hypothetical protein
MWILQGPQFFVDLQEGVLCNLFGDVEIPYFSPRKRVDRPLVLFYQLRESTLVACKALLDEFDITVFH